VSELFDDFRSIVLNNTPLIDVRAPVEFKKGAFLNAANLPIMSDEERHEVGICYKNKGNAKAVELGHKLVSGDIKEQRLQAWLDFMDKNPDALLYCFRGGQRSRIAQQWIKERGREIVRLKGGYKAFRSYLLGELENSYRHFKPLFLGGRTGSGKTIELKKMQNSIDLEGLANHRGSSFGQKITPQTSQIGFENNLIYKIVQKLEDGYKTLVFEDEGKHVGSVFMPDSFIEIIPKSSLVILERPMDERIEITMNEYVLDAQKTYESAGYDNALQAWQLSIKSAMERIKRRLGDQRHREVLAIFEEALGEQKRSGSYEKYRDWVEYLLREYYDPMYDYQIQKRSHLVAFRGNASEVHEYIKSIV